MSVQLPWPNGPGSDSESSPDQGQQPAHNGWAQQPQPPAYSQQPGPYAPQQPAAPFGQPYYGIPGEIPGAMIPAPKKKHALAWILAGGGVVVLAVVVTAVVLMSGLFAGGNKATMVDAPTTSASFQYPEGWVRTGENVTIIKEDGSQPAENFSAVDNSGSASSMMIYQAGERPTGDVTTEKIHAAIDQGLADQLAASQDDLVYFRSTSAFGCLQDFSYTSEPVIVQRDGLYGYSYGYTCFSTQGEITGKYLVAYDTKGVSHRMTVEAVNAEWARSEATLTSIVDSLKPAL